MLSIQDVTYVHPNKDALFENINFTINKNSKAALIGNNGAGKSCLLKILSGHLHPVSGHVKASSKPYYIPQHFGQFDKLTIAEALQAGDKIKALRQILDGEVTEANMTMLDEDWEIEKNCKDALKHWELKDLNLDHKMSRLSGGQKTKVFLAGIKVHSPEIILMDEPTNNLDRKGREMLYDYIKTSSATLLVVSHDRTLLNLLSPVLELSKTGIRIYGGNYDFYAEQKENENNTLKENLKNKEKALRKAKEIEKESLERKNKLDARGKKKQEKAGLPKIRMKTLKNNAEKSTSRIKEVHADKIENIFQGLNHFRKELPDQDKMKIDLDNSILHKGKILFRAEEINFAYSRSLLWKAPLSFQITSGERIAIKGSNGSGKTTLLKIILSELQPNPIALSSGILERAEVKTIYMDQDYSLIKNELTVFEQVQDFNTNALQEHELKIRLNRFLFTKASWNKVCKDLSGGEKMRLMLCMLSIKNTLPDIIVLDEPTNNLDLQNIEILSSAINEYKGTLLVVSHDDYFLEQINVNKVIDLD